MIHAVVFDAYGTLFNVDAVSEVAEQVFPGNGKIISKVWRQKQLEYTWLRSLMVRYVNFEQVNRDALIYTLNELGKSYSERQVNDVLASYLTLPAFPEVPTVLSTLHPPKVILSNGTEAMFQGLISHAGLEALFDRVLSADIAKTYKPHHRVYELAIQATSLPKEQILFVSSNGWDVAGAKSFGFTVAWINRKAKPVEELGVHPDFIIPDLSGLPGII